LPVSQENVGYPVLHGDYLLFNSPGSGIDNIYAIDLNTEKRYQVTSSRLGAYNPAVSTDGQTLYYNDQTRDGHDVVSIPFNPATWRPFVSGRTSRMFFRDLVEQEGHPDIFSDVPAAARPQIRHVTLSGFKRHRRCCALHIAGDR
jgi:tricorn protease-like protein